MPVLSRQFFCTAARALRRRRQRDRQPRSTFDVFGLDGAAHVADDTGAHGQAQARPRAYLLGGEERLEDALTLTAVFIKGMHQFNRGHPRRSREQTQIPEVTGFRLLFDVSKNLHESLCSLKLLTPRDRRMDQTETLLELMTLGDHCTILAPGRKDGSHACHRSSGAGKEEIATAVACTDSGPSPPPTRTLP